MQYQYIKIPGSLENSTTSIKMIKNDGSVSYVPCVADNKDYLAYQEWIALGNEPLASEE